MVSMVRWWVSHSSCYFCARQCGSCATRLIMSLTNWQHSLLSTRWLLAKSSGTSGVGTRQLLAEPRRPAELLILDDHDYDFNADSHPHACEYDIYIYRGVKDLPAFSTSCPIQDLLKDLSCGVLSCVVHFSAGLTLVSRER
jgi:hypothetical protein